MFVKTENQGIINLNHYRSIEVHPMQDAYALRAITSMHYEERRDYDDIATFDEEKVAFAALNELFRVLEKGEHTWNASSFKTNWGVPPVMIGAIVEGNVE